MTKNNIINATIYKNSINTSKLDNTVITKKEEELKNLEKEITELTNKIETNTAAFKNANTTSAQTLKLAQVKNNSLEYKIENGNLESEKNTKNKRKINATQRYLNAKKNYMANINKNMEKINEMQDELNKKNKAKIALDKELSDIKEKKNKLNTYTQKQTNLNINNMSQQTKYIKANLLDYLDSIYKNVETVYSDLKTKQADPNVIKKTGEILNNIYKTKKDPSKLFKNTSKNITSQVTTPSQTSQTSLMSPQLV
jgi:chromosome segregation ATPase